MAYKKGASLGLTSNNTVNNPKSGYSLTTGEFVGITPSEQDISNSLNSILPDLSPVRAVTSLNPVDFKNSQKIAAVDTISKIKNGEYAAKYSVEFAFYLRLRTGSTRPW